MQKALLKKKTLVKRHSVQYRFLSFFRSKHFHFFCIVAVFSSPPRSNSFQHLMHFKILFMSIFLSWLSMPITEAKSLQKEPDCDLKVKCNMQVICSSLRSSESFRQFSFLKSFKGSLIKPFQIRNLRVVTCKRESIKGLTSWIWMIGWGKWKQRGKKRWIKFARGFIFCLGNKWEVFPPRVTWM